MTGKSHLIFGLGTAIITAAVSPTPLISFLYVPVVGISSLLPDIDSKSSIIGRKAKIIGGLFKHRGIIHTPLCASLFLFVPYNGLKWAIILGFLSHLFLDLLNKGGIMLLWPLSSKKIKISNLKSGSRWELFIVTTLLIVEAATVVFCKFF